MALLSVICDVALRPEETNESIFLDKNVLFQRRKINCIPYITSNEWARQSALIPRVSTFKKNTSLI